MQLTEVEFAEFLRGELDENDEVAEALLDRMSENGYDDETQMPPVDSVSTFEEDGIMTRNVGLVVTLADGSEYQITIVKSR